MLPARAGMAPASAGTGAPSARAPRASGDGPAVTAASRYGCQCSPRERGWPLTEQLGLPVDLVLPARAGMALVSDVNLSGAVRAPRASGDGPDFSEGLTKVNECSPARAGMAPMWLRMRVRIVSAPRASGDGPRPSSRECQTCRCSPRERGWPPSPGTDSVTRRVLPARAGMAPLESSTHERRHRAPRASGDGPPTQPAQSLPPECSPRERGWPAARGPVVRQQAVLPARAGMAPSRALGATWICGAPRASGDGPRALDVLDSQDACSPRERGWPLAHPCGAGAGPVLPARAGMAPAAPPSPSPTSGAPRASGDGPEAVGAALSGGGCSPRERGWPGGPHGHHLPASVLPARAGMALNPSLGLLGIVRAPARGGVLDRLHPPRAPRASGDGPIRLIDAWWAARCSPRERGWPGVRCSASRGHDVLPARAGMAPPRGTGGGPCPGAPRASGDGPHRGVDSGQQGACSPRERGWPLQRTDVHLHVPVLPARAGMAPTPSSSTSPSPSAPRASGDGPR